MLKDKMIMEHDKRLKEIASLEKSCKKTTKETANVNKNVENSVERTKKINDYLDSLSPSDKDKVLKEIQYRKARDSYPEYIKLCYPEYIITPFHKFLCDICQSVVRRIEKANMPNASEEDIQNGRVRILLSVPPRHGKSETVTKSLPSWFVGRNPDKRAILTAYNSEMAEKFNNANRQKVKDFGKQIFGIETSESQDNKGLFEIANHRGSIMGCGIGGGITGNGGELIIVDDPYKSSADANSPAERKNLEEVFRSAVVTRLQSKGNALIVIQTRWHEEDLCGVLAKEDGWIVINIPAVCEDEAHDPLRRKIGQTLCPELGFDARWAELTEKSVGSKVWNALYMGKPTIDGGEIFKDSMIRQYKRNELPMCFEELTMSCDLSFGGIKQSNDPCAIQVWGRVGANHYLIHRTKKRMTFNEMCEKIKSIRALFPQIKRIIVEKKANGQSVIDTLNSTIGGFVAYDPKMDSKVARANAVTYLFESGNVFLPDKSVDKTIDEMINELEQFPNSAHDDEVDAMTQYLITWDSRNGGKVITDKSFATLSDLMRGFRA